MGLHYLSKLRDVLYFARKSVRLEPVLLFFHFRERTILKVGSRLHTGLPEAHIRPPPSWRQRTRQGSGLTRPIHGDLDPLGLAIHFVVSILKISKRPDRC